MRGIFIAVGAAAIQNFSWIFYVFGAFLMYTAVKLATQGESHDDDFEENRLLKWVERRFPATQEWNGVHLTARVAGKKVITPMLIVILALGTTDLLFALDSIPAIFGLTKEPLPGLHRQRLRPDGAAAALLPHRRAAAAPGLPQPRALSVVLGFIGVKLVMEALHENELPFINGGEHIDAIPEIPILVSLGVILGVLAVTTWPACSRSGATRTRFSGPRPRRPTTRPRPGRSRTRADLRRSSSGPR